MKTQGGSCAAERRRRLPGWVRPARRLDFRSGDCLFHVGAAAADHGFILLEGSVPICAQSPVRPFDGIDRIDTPGRLFGWEAAACFQHAGPPDRGDRRQRRGGAARGHRRPGRRRHDRAEGRLSHRYLCVPPSRRMDDHRNDIAAGAGRSLPAAAAGHAGRGPVAQQLQDGRLFQPRGTAARPGRARPWRVARSCMRRPRRDRTVGRGQWNSDPQAAAEPRPLSRGNAVVLGPLAARRRSSCAMPQTCRRMRARNCYGCPQATGRAWSCRCTTATELRGALYLAFSSAGTGFPKAVVATGSRNSPRILALDLARRQDRHHCGKLAHQDRLTGLTNGLLFQDRLQLALARARRADRSVPCCIWTWTASIP